ncbi:MAG: acetate kinase [Phycisphaerae bacterium SM23_33]|jgi:acetate kinase|nr:MAG: acetate kinase [Phycisphaerae bacterium SM23_33]
MKVFVVNCGSSSIKYRLFDMADESVLAGGLLERVGQPNALLHHVAGQKSRDRGVQAPDHGAGLKLVIAALTDAEVGVIRRVEEIHGVGHRVVHGGEQIRQSKLIDPAVIEVIRQNCELAPLHNPPNLAGIEAARSALPATPQVAVFDTAFLSTLPPHAFRYAVPEDWYRRYHVRRYGFHGTSHRYVSLRAAELLGKDPRQVNLITCHLGNGCSMTAVAAGKAVDHSMGLTPLEGLVMGTRSGDLDPAVIFHMARRAGLSLEQLDEALNTRSGLLGVSQVSNDMRDVLSAAAGGRESAALAVELFVYRLAKYVGAYYAILPGVDAVVLTGGIGENAVPVRRELCRRLERLGAVGDPQRNETTVGGQAGAITTQDSPLPVWVVPTDEELMIARDTRALVQAGE